MRAAVGVMSAIHPSQADETITGAETTHGRRALKIPAAAFSTLGLM